MFCVTPCAICPNRDDYHNIVQFDGPDTASVLVVGEGPGFFEWRRKLPFVGKTGREMDTLYFRLAGLSRPNTKLANAVACFFGGDNQTKEQAGHCANHNLAKLVQSMPYLSHVVLMGAVACSVLDWAAYDAETGAKLSAPNMLTEHGLPFHHGRDVLLFGVRVKVFCTYHPASGLHQPSAINDLTDDFEGLNKWRSKSWKGEEDQFPNPIYMELTDKTKTPIDLLSGPMVAFDTELDSKRRPWCAQITARAGEGYMARAGARNLEVVQKALDLADVILIHNYKFDRDVSAELGLKIPLEKVVDTWVLAYVLSLPQSMKTLARRFCGMEMLSWEDIVNEQFEQDAINWFVQASAAVNDYTNAWEARVKAEVREIAEQMVEPGVKNRRNLVNREHKLMWEELLKSGQDEWQPPSIAYVNKNGLSTRRRSPAYGKQIELVLSQHVRSKEQEGDGVDFAGRWYGKGEEDEEGEELTGLRNKLPIWALDLIRDAAGTFPSRGLDRAPYEQAKDYSCRDVDALIRLGPKVIQMADQARVGGVHCA